MVCNSGVSGHVAGSNHALESFLKIFLSLSHVLIDNMDPYPTLSCPRFTFLSDFDLLIGHWEHDAGASLVNSRNPGANIT